MFDKPLRKERREFKLICPERMDVAERAVFNLAESLRILGISGWTLPNIKEKFVESSEGKLELGRTGVVNEIEAEIVFDTKFRKKESQRNFEVEMGLRDFDYQGMEQVFKHELAHLVMWSVTKLPHQQAVRLIDEGWATLVEHLGTDEARTITELTSLIKFKVQSIKRENPENYQRCLDLEHPVSERVKEDLETAEYYVGAGLLLWVLENQGRVAMIDLIRKTPSTSRRTSTDQIKIFSALNPNVHKGYSSYQKGIVDPLRRGNLSAEDLQKIGEIAIEWEAEQFRSALLEVTEMKSIEDIRETFMAWLGWNS